MAVNRTSSSPTQPIDLLARRLAAFGEFGPVEADRLRRSGGTLRHFKAGADFGHVGGRSSVIGRGWAGRYHALPDGRSQLFELLIPGDVMQSKMDDRDRTSSLTPVVVAEITELASALQGPGAKCWAAALCAAQEALFDHAVRLGRLSAYERTAHLLLELHERLGRVGLTTGSTFAIPVTQKALADLLGLSLVHLGRTLQQLRQDALIVGSPGIVTLLQMGRLARLSGYESLAGRVLTTAA